jgi:RNA recognition motif-containing protein
MANTVSVKNIAEQTDDKEIKDFFSFCGKISDIKVVPEGSTKSATVVFEKETAAKTALLLNNTKLGPNEISVTGSGSSEDEAAHHKLQAERDSDEITQEEKPRARILAEYLAHGYLVADTGLKSAIALDEKHGVSQRFLSTIQQLDSKYHATDRAKATDQTYGISQRANSLLTGLNSYFEKAIDNPTGKKIASFYTTGQRQVSDIHAEAKRLAELKKQEHGGSSYKAAGLDKVFGAEKPKPAPAAPSDTPAAPSAADQSASKTA